VYASNRSRKAHLLDPNDSVNQGNSLCGLGGPLGRMWMGTGTQREHEHAAELPLCAQCADYVEP
jgi:hypothetical protein